ncbi:hypothetical protein GCM10010961_36210 [Pseudodonghicola xiamenensis]|uniref:Uncharacterized protein n=2 Tax=Pseudodonghicola xiamenensis TaxID=337702 RepID=A0A8J3MDZ8_9RHOB|nr:hypothetical protein GCM10010961_36210 [Pseudodonghicola xiamenensis]
MEETMRSTLHPAPQGGLPVPALPDPDHPAIDSESAALLRGWLQPLIADSPSWPALEQALAAHGYGLAFRNGRLCLMRDDVCLCSMRFVGVGLRDLAPRLGRPTVRPQPGAACGMLCPRP